MRKPSYCYRPYYVKTPRNIYGQDLAGPGPHRPSYEIMSTDTGTKVYVAGKNKEALQQQANELNDAHETMLAYAMHI
jgi:hypothetical protein